MAVESKSNRSCNHRLCAAGFLLRIVKSLRIAVRSPDASASEAEVQADTHISHTHTHPSKIEQSLSLCAFVNVFANKENLGVSCVRAFPSYGPRMPLIFGGER